MRVQIYTHLNPGIEETHMYVVGEGKAYSHYYDSENNEGYVYEVTGRLIFSAVAAAGYKFTRWVVRSGNTMADSTVQYVTTEVYQHTSGKNLWIRAEAEATTNLGYELDSTALGTITKTTSVSFDTDGLVLYRMSLRFVNDGTATFYSTGGCDTIGFLTTDSGWDEATGVPTGTLYRSDDDSGEYFNYKFTYDVAKNVTYYYWFKQLNSEDSGFVTAYVIPPGLKGGNAYIYTADGWKQTAVYIYDGSSWKPVKVSMFDGTTWK